VQAQPKTVPVDGVLVIDSSNNSQQRGPHGAFRYFGKLAPDVTGRILDLAKEHVDDEKMRVVDLMCGSGTTLLESADRGWLSIGVDVNPVAILYSRVKTTPVDSKRVLRALRSIELSDFEPSAADVASVFGSTFNAARWFSEEAQSEVTRLRLLINRVHDERTKSLLLAVLLSRLRKISNASAKTGRIFYDPDSAEKETRVRFSKSVHDLLERIPRSVLDISVLQGDARKVPIEDGFASISFCHPPYFALYRYSSDVLRFELEIGGWARRAVQSDEVAEGWKSGDPLKLDDHVRDMSNVFLEANRITKPGGVFVLVTSNSTLGDVQMPVIDRLAQGAAASGLQIVKHYERKAHFGSASYHRSARTDKVIEQDHVLIFQAH
jgi:site-specific DNA-methyltransferase (cytosine-N4-specific)